MNKRLEQLLKLKALKELELELIEAEIAKLESPVKEKVKKNEELLEEKPSVAEPPKTLHEKIHEELYEEKEEIRSDCVKEDLLREIKDFPRYLINGKGEVFHETGIQIPTVIENGKVLVELFDRENNKVKVEVSTL